MTKDIPGEERDPLVDLARFTFVGAVHVAALEFRAENAHVVIHESLELQGILDVVQLVHRLLAARIEFIAASAEEILENVAL